MVCYFKRRWSDGKFNTIWMCVVAAFCVASAVHFGVVGAYRNMVLALACGLLVFPGLTMFEYMLKMRFVPVFMFLLCFLFVGGIILGPGFDLYFKLPCWDDILHTSSGLIFACLGYTFADGVVSDNLKHRKFVCFAIAIACSLAIALLWEMFEYAGTTFLRMDMQEDQLVYKIRSFFLAGSHNEIVEIDGITKTVIYYGNGQTYVIDGGYLDIGLYDTLNDMLVCLVGSLFLPVLFGVGRIFGKSPEHWIVPQWFRQNGNALRDDD